MRTTKQQAYKTALIAMVTALAMVAASGTFAIATTTGNERIAAEMDPPSVFGWGWSPNLDVSVHVTGLGFDETQIGNTGPDGFFRFDFSAMEPGFVVTATSDGHVESHTVARVTNVAADEVTDTVSGDADVGIQLTAWVDAGTPVDRTFTVASDPFTSPSFSVPPGAGEGTGTFDLVPGTQGGVFWQAVDLNYTVHRWSIPNPSVRVSWAGDDVVTSNEDWPLGADVEISFDLLPETCNQIVPVTEAPEDGWVGFYTEFDSEFCDIVPGEVVTATSGDITTSVEVTPLQIMGIDEDLDQVFGVADLGSDVRVYGGNEESDGERLVTSNGEIPPGYGDFDPSMFGWWVADFTETGLALALDGWGSVDIRSGTGGEAAQADLEGDETFEGWGLEDPWIAVHRDESRVAGGNFDPGTVPLTVDDPDTTGEGFEPDFETSVDVDEWGNIHAELGEFITIEPGFVVTAGEESLVVSGIAVTSVDADTGVVAGTAEPDVPVEVWIHEEFGEWHQTTSDGGANWTVTFSSLWPGVAGGALVADDDGDSTQVDWSIPNPSVRVNWAEDYVTSNEDWPLGALLTVTVEDSIGAVKCVTDPPAEVVDWDGWTGFEWWASCDIVPGDVVTATSGDISTSVVVTPLQVLGVDEDADLVFGVAELGSEVNVNGGNDESWGWRSVVADGGIPPEYEAYFDETFGWWTADFTESGYNSPGDDGDGWFDIRPGTGGEASQFDAEGDETFEWWGIDEPAFPRFTVQRDPGGVWGGGFEPFEELTVAVDENPAGGDGDEFVSDPFFADENGDFGINVGEYWTFAPSQLVTVGSKSLVLSSVDVTLVDPVTGEVAGTAEPDVPVQVWIHDEFGEWYETTSNGAGNWSVTFTELLPGTTGAASVLDEDLDETYDDWWVPNPSVRANWVDDYVQSNEDWQLGAFVTVTVEDSIGAEKCVTDEPLEVVDWDGWTGFEWWLDPALCDIVPGDVVTATTGDGPDGITTSVVVTPLQVLGVDEDAELVFGVAESGSEVQVNGGNEESWGWRNVVADGDIPEEWWPDFDPGFFGWWVADFTESGYTVPGEDGDGTVDIRPGTGGEASQFDADGDQTFEWWNVPERPGFTVQRDNSDVWGWNLEPGVIPLTVDDPTTTGAGFEPDFETTVEVDEGGNFGIWIGEFITIEPGFVVTVGDKSLIVSSIEVDTVDEASGVVAGMAEPEAPVEVWIHEEGGEFHHTTADEFGDWSVTFTSLWPGVAGGVAVFDDDGDQTQVDWSLPNPSVRVNWANDYVTSNADWPTGADVTISFELLPAACDEIVTVFESDGVIGFELWLDSATCDIVPGEVVTATSGDISTSVMVTPLQIMGSDEEADLVFGVAEFGTLVHVNGDDEEMWGWRNVVADGPIPEEHQADLDESFGWWVADFTETGLAEALDGDGWFDIRPRAGGEASQTDADGNDTFEWWNVNRPPVAVDDILAELVSEDDPGPVDIDALGNDWDPDGDEITYESHDASGTLGEVAWNGSSFEYYPEGAFDHLAAGETATDSWSYIIADGRGGQDEGIVEVRIEGVNDRPTMDGQPGRTVQYSDGLVPIVFTAVDVDSDALIMTATGLPASLTYASSCAPEGLNGVICTLTISGTVTTPAGEYEVEVTADDGQHVAVASTTIIVIHENADVSLHGGNDAAIPVAQHDESGPFELTFKIRHADPDVGFASTAGDLSLAGTALTLDPVGPGGPIHGLCDSVTETGSGYDTMLTVVCTFNDVPINTYLVIASADSDYFEGDANGVLTVYDPNAGEVSGGGTFDWSGDPTEFGFTLEYNKKGNNLQGAFLLIRHTADGVYIVKSNSLYGMAIGDDWATFSGKATLTYPNGETVGNQEFIVRVTDDPDTFWIEVRDKDRSPVSAMSMPRDGEGEPIAPVPLASGEVVVPNANGNGNGGGRGNR